VALLQLRLAELGYRPGNGDGHYGAATASAVMAFQKREGLARDGIAGSEVLGRLANPTGAGARNPSGPRHLEIDLDRQIGLFVADDGTTTTINISSGNGASYVNPKTKVRSRAITPIGEFAVYRKVDGTEKAPLGTLYRPAYFKGGWAVHGSPSVPGYPASHGCVRTANADQDWLFPQLVKGTPVIIYRGPPQAPVTTAPLPADAAPGD
jgi:peptidoglycan hydrolase-like protein with peptidoglycan-binding domain